MTNKLRSTTNLVVPQHLRLKSADRRKRFMYVYTAAYPGLEPVFMNRLWLSHFFPQIASDPSFGKNRKGVRLYVQAAEKYSRAGLLKLKKVNDTTDPHFVVAVPLAEFNRYDLQNYVNQLKFWFTNGKGDHSETDNRAQALTDALKSNAENPEVQQQQVLAAQIIPHLGLDANSQLALKECFFGLRLQYVGGLAVVFADFKIAKDEAQQLTSTDWAMIRNMDLYPLMLQWQISLWGYRDSAPTSSFPMSKISKTLPPIHESQARINEHGLSVAPDGSVLWLPERLDNTKRYEDLYSQVGDKGDDTFGLIDMGEAGHAATTGEELKIKLPANIPVLVDWVNNRFAYTQGNGVLKVQDLTRFKTCDDSHAANLLNHWLIDSKDAMMFMEMGKSAGVPDALYFTEEEAKEIEANDPMTAGRLIVGGGVSVEQYWDTAYDYHRRFVNEKDFKLADISIEGDPIWRPFARFIETVQAAVISNMDAVNQKFSVSGTASRLGTMTLIAKYGNNLTQTLTKSNTIRAAATNQGVDPNWRPESVPLIMDNPERPFSLLPHQAKVRNIMKDSPDFAILPVQAGGGKTPLAIIDILMEIKAGRSAPYLVLCPAPLVPQYVKEVTYFTSGQVNCIPIVSDVIFRNGFDRLQEMVASAPRNTIVIVNYDVLRNKAYDVCYGTTNVKIYPVIEFLRQFNFGYAMMDESHNLKNDSQRTRAALQLIADIPKKRLASGTMAHDSPSDLALQVAMLDPTLFGSREKFNKRFGAVVKGNRVIEWKPGAQQQIMSMIRSRIVVAKAMRKEWAALLPMAKEDMHLVEMSEAQHSVYQAILTEAFDKMREDAKTNPALKKFFESQPLMLENPQKNGDEGLDEEADQEAEDAADENAGEDLEGLLGFYLARLEQFLTAPGKDELGARLLHGDDLRSPKVNKILELIKMHIAQGIEGKVLVFTNYIESAEEIFEAAGPELQASGILYTAGEKVEAGAAFETDAKKKWMVGVENSMNTGLNFQHVSRLIRVENVWNPGTLEQGNSRINRPELKKADRREMIYFDWIAVNRTYDVTKISRLISKIIAVSKFENAENPAYDALPDVPVIPMSADAILARNTREDLIEYADAYREHNQVKFDDYKEYRERHGELSLTPLMIAPRPKDAAIMSDVPYVPGLELFKGSERGLVRVDEFLRTNDTAVEVADKGGEGDDEGDEGADETKMTEKERKNKALADALIGKLVHTEFGDGVVKGIAASKKRVNVSLPNGYWVAVKYSAAFVITDKAVKGVEMRQQIIKGISEDMPVVGPLTTKSPRFKPDKAGARLAEQKRLAEEQERLKKQKEEQIVNGLNIELHFSISNGFLSIVYYPEDGDDASAALQALGFRPEEPYVFAEVRNSPQLVQQFKKWWDAGFRFDPKFEKATGAAEAIKDLSKLLKSGTLHNGQMGYKFASRNQMVNFFRMELKPSANPKEFKPYPMIEDGGAYLVMHTRGQPATKAAMQVRSPGIRWQHAADRMAYYGLTVDKVSAKMREILASGIQIMNLKDLQVEFKKLKKQKFRNAEVEQDK
jgi:SNF2 family DNA or RNA helicase